MATAKFGPWDSKLSGASASGVFDRVLIQHSGVLLVAVVVTVIPPTLL